MARAMASRMRRRSRRRGAVHRPHQVVRPSSWRSYPLGAVAQRPAASVATSRVARTIAVDGASIEAPERPMHASPCRLRPVRGSDTSKRRTTKHSHHHPQERRMLTKFDSLFAGHIDMEDVGYGGTAVNDRRFSNEALARVRQDPGHGPAHGTGWATTPSGWLSTIPARGLRVHSQVLMYAVHLAHLTRRLRLGRVQVSPCGIPSGSPRTSRGRHLTGGRVTFGGGAAITTAR